MCGIVGIIFRDPARRVETARLVAARDALTHRGPDEAGLWSVPGAALGHRRLKVLDLTHGQQPMVGPAQRQALVYNGEVYNFRALREEYRARGATFAGDGDTEVVFAALNQHGAAALAKFNGMFAFGHWDDQARTLLLARDRLGKKPLYWYADEEQIVFASELKAILVFLDRRFDVDPIALDHYFSRGYIPAPGTIFLGIQKLPAGCLLRAHAGGARGGVPDWRWEVEPWWDFSPREVPADPAEALDELDELLTDAVRMRMVSDVPIGCLLSGGIDSSLITALAAKVTAEPVKAFSIGFAENEALNELPYAQMVAERHGCQWFKQEVRGGDFMADLAETAPFLDEPYGNFTVFSMRRLARLARQELVVVLSGQGGDELSGGYPGRYNWALEHAGEAMTRYAPPVDDLVQHLNHRSFVRWRGGCESVFGPGLQEAIRREVTPADDALPFWRRHAGLDRLNNVLYTDVKTNLADYLICLEERMTMSCSLEARNPLLDYRVVDLMLSLPQEMKVREGRNKWVLMELARRYVPAGAIDRPKRGFTPPLDQWMAGNAAALAREFAATDGQTAGIYSPGWRQFLLQGRFPAGTIMPAFYSLMLGQWVKHYGSYIGAWPTEARVGVAGEKAAPGVVPGAGAGAAGREPWQRALRMQDPLALAEARWFCQAMGNFAAGAAVEVRGDDSGWYGFLARGCGLSVAARGAGGGLGAAATAAAADAPGEGKIYVGLDSLRGLAAGGAGVAAAAPGAMVLIFAPYKAAEAAEVQALLRQLAGCVAIKGFQATPLLADAGVLIARVQMPATAAAVA